MRVCESLVEYSTIISVVVVNSIHSQMVQYIAKPIFI